MTLTTSFCRTNPCIVFYNVSLFADLTPQNLLIKGSSFDFITSKVGLYSYKRFYVNLLLIKGTLIFRQAQMFQHSRKILKLLFVYFGLLFHSWRGDGVRDGGCYLMSQAEFTVMYCNIIFKRSIMHISTSKT